LAKSRQEMKYSMETLKALAAAKFAAFFFKPKHTTLWLD